MRKIVLEHYEGVREDTGEPEIFDYAEYLKMCILHAPAADGATYADIKQIDLFKQAMDSRTDGYVLLEEETFRVVAAKLPQAKWSRWTKYTSKFVEDMLAAPQVQVAPVVAEAA